MNLIIHIYMDTYMHISSINIHTYIDTYTSHIYTIYTRIHIIYIHIYIHAH